MKMHCTRNLVVHLYSSDEAEKYYTLGLYLFTYKNDKGRLDFSQLLCSSLSVNFQNEMRDLLNSNVKH